MTSTWQRAVTWQADHLKVVAGRSVTIRQGAKPPVAVTGWIFTRQDDVVNSEGFATKVTAYEWRFKTSDLGTLVLRKGDVILDVQTGKEYEILPVEGMPAVDGVDTSGLQIKANTKLVA